VPAANRDLNRRVPYIENKTQQAKIDLKKGGFSQGNR
jgi:hypothetical protein